MARQQKLIHLHGSTQLTKERATHADIDMATGELAMMNGTTETSELYVLTSDGNIATFVTGAKVAGDIATAKNQVDTAAKGYANTALTDAKAYTDTREGVLQGQIDALSNKVGTTDVAAQIQNAVDAEKTRAEAAEKANADAIDANAAAIKAISDDYLKAADKTELNNLITGLTATVNANETDIEGKMSAEITRAKAAEAAAETNAKAHADDLNTAMNTRVAALEDDTHTHANKALLDTSDQTNANIKDAVEKKHAHTNKAELDLIKSGDKAKWDDAADAINAFMDAENVGDAVVNTLKEIQDYITTDGAAANTMTQNIAKNAQDIAAEKSRAEAAEAALQTAIDAKVAKSDYNAKVAELVAADAANTTAINNEVTRADAAEKANADAIKAISDDYLKASDKTELQNAIDAVDKAYKAADSAFTTALNAAKDRIKNLEDAGYVKTVSVQNSNTNKITATESADGTVTLNFDNMVIDCGTY